MAAAAEPAISLFHSQQAVEKTAKSLIAAHRPNVLRTHDLREVGRQCAQLAPHLEPLLQGCAELTDFAVVFRYLEAPYEPDQQEALGAVAKATALYNAIKSELDL